MNTVDALKRWYRTALRKGIDARRPAEHDADRRLDELVDLAADVRSVVLGNDDPSRLDAVQSWFATLPGEDALFPRLAEVAAQELLRRVAQAVDPPARAAALTQHALRLLGEACRLGDKPDAETIDILQSCPEALAVIASWPPIFRKRFEGEA